MQSFQEQVVPVIPTDSSCCQKSFFYIVSLQRAAVPARNSSVDFCRLQVLSGYVHLLQDGVLLFPRRNSLLHHGLWGTSPLVSGALLLPLFGWTYVFLLSCTASMQQSVLFLKCLHHRSTTAVADGLSFGSAQWSVYFLFIARKSYVQPKSHSWWLCLLHSGVCIRTHAKNTALNEKQGLRHTEIFCFSSVFRS